MLDELTLTSTTNLMFSCLKMEQLLDGEAIFKFSFYFLISNYLKINTF